MDRDLPSPARGGRQHVDRHSVGAFSGREIDRAAVRRNRSEPGASSGLWDPRPRPDAPLRTRATLSPLRRLRVRNERLVAQLTFVNLLQRLTVEEHHMRKPTTDHQPGSPPEIRVVPEGIVFEFDETSGELGARLVIRCDNDGNVYVRISPRNIK
jgi:hypothetical protein